MRTERLRFPRIKTVLLIGAVTVAAAITVSASPALASTQFKLDSKSLIPALARAQVPSDVPSREVLASSVGAEFRLSSARSIAVSDTASYFVAEGAAPGDLCLVVELKSAQMSASVCTDRGSFYRRGLALDLRGEEAHSEQVATAYLIPPDVQPTPGHEPTRNASVTASSAQIIVIPTGGAGPDPAQFARVKSQTPFHLTVLADIDD
ncbi:hypothetical protein [Microbacterium sp. E-13]|uniref:hypothetical protein n=1 Tax=Microbacterium sp. E-13 TaxID=3404048 RepID=UPI003CF1FCA8